MAFHRKSTSTANWVTKTRGAIPEKKKKRMNANSRGSLELAFMEDNRVVLQRAHVRRVQLMVLAPQPLSSTHVEQQAPPPPPPPPGECPQRLVALSQKKKKKMKNERGWLRQHVGVNSPHGVLVTLRRR